MLAGGDAETEMKKQIVTVARNAPPCWIIDNVTGTWRSSALATMISSGIVNERILGSNDNYLGPCRFALLATGNNASLDRDLARRFVRIRLDHGIECPQTLSFPFEPPDKAREMRLEIVRSILVILQGWRNAGSPETKGGTGFPGWSKFVRGPVVWLQESGIAKAAGLGGLGDPAHSIISADGMGVDPETEQWGAVLRGLHVLMDGNCFKAADLAKECRDYLAGRRQGAGVDDIRDDMADNLLAYFPHSRGSVPNYYQHWKNTVKPER
jgi:hypothetical protein